MTPFREPSPRDYYHDYPAPKPTRRRKWRRPSWLYWNVERNAVAAIVLLFIGLVAGAICDAKRAP